MERKHILTATNIVSGKEYALPTGAMIADYDKLRCQIEGALVYTTYRDIVTKWNSASDALNKVYEAEAKGEATGAKVAEAEAKAEKAHNDVKAARARVLGIDNIDDVYTEENNKRFDALMSGYIDNATPFSLLLVFCMTGTKSVSTSNIERVITENMRDAKTLNDALNGYMLPVLKNNDAVKPFTSGITKKGFENLVRVRDVIKRTWTNKGIKTATTKPREFARQTLLTTFEIGYNMTITDDKAYIIEL